MKHYEFSILLNAFGENQDEAWEEAIQGFIDEPGCLSDNEVTFIEELDEDGNEFEPRKIIKDLASTNLLEACITARNFIAADAVMTVSECLNILDKTIARAKGDE